MEQPRIEIVTKTLFGPDGAPLQTEPAPEYTSIISEYTDAVPGFTRVSMADVTRLVQHYYGDLGRRYPNAIETTCTEVRDG